MKVLITGFEPFGGYTENVSWVVTKEVAAQGVSGVEIATALMPVSFERVAEELRDALKKHRPNLIIMLGQSGGSEHIKLERIAINMMDSKLSDNDNYTPNEEPIYPEAPAALFTNLSIKSLCKAIEGQDIAVKISNSAGLYVCNRIYYESLMLCKEYTQMKAIFVHLPLFEGQPSAKPGKPQMALCDMVKAIQTIIDEVV